VIELAHAQVHVAKQLLIRVVHHAAKGCGTTLHEDALGAWKTEDFGVTVRRWIRQHLIRANTFGLAQPPARKAQGAQSGWGDIARAPETYSDVDDSDVGGSGSAAAPRTTAPSFALALDDSSLAGVVRARGRRAL
jgi:hypothetical protein